MFTSIAFNIDDIIFRVYSLGYVDIDAWEMSISCWPPLLGIVLGEKPDTSLFVSKWADMRNSRSQDAIKHLTALEKRSQGIF